MQANKEFGLAGKKVLNDDSIIHCAMSIQRRMQEAHLQVPPHFATDSLLPLQCVVTMLMTKTYDVSLAHPSGTQTACDTHRSGRAGPLYWGPSL